MATARHAATLVLALCALPACSGSVSPDEQPATNGSVSPDSPDAAVAAQSDETTGNSTEIVAPEPTASSTAPEVSPTSEPVEPTPTVTTRKPGEVTRFARLTHDQYDNTVRELLGVDSRPSSTFAPDALNGFAFSSSTDFIVDARLAPQYRGAAETLAEQVTVDADVYAKVVPCTDESEQCRDEFISDFGRKAFRRPLTSTQTAAFTALFDQGSDLVASGDAFSDGVRVVVEAILQSPQFLYRTELSTQTAEDDVIALDDYDVASRLSYFIFNSMPDQTLFDAAAASDLHTIAAVSEQVTRMLEDPRALDQFVSFHEQAWSFNRYNNIAPDPNKFPDAPSDLNERLLTASQYFLSDVIAEGGGVQDFLTAPFAYADPAIAPLFGTQVDDGFQRIDLDPNERLGLLAQPGFLASHAYAQKTDPIHRGLFVVRELLCRGIGEPPAGASMAQLPEGSAPKTTREEVELLTAPDSCSPCHVLFNPMGFAFEGFDALGQVRTDEDGEPINTAGTITVDGAELEIDGAIDLIQAIAPSDEVKRCYAKKWFSFAHGRNVTNADMPVVDGLVADLSVQEIVAAIVSDPSYLTRPNAEVQQ